MTAALIKAEAEAHAAALARLAVAAETAGHADLVEQANEAKAQALAVAKRAEEKL